MWCRFLKAALRNGAIINTSNVDYDPVQQDQLAKQENRVNHIYDFDIFISEQN